MTNYVEVKHEYADEDGEYVVTYYAVCPSPDVYAFFGNERETSFAINWQLMGTNLYVHEQADIDGLRKLLDKIEEQLNYTE